MSHHHVTVARARVRIDRALRAVEHSFDEKGEYDNGYRDALMDALLLLDGIVPDRNGWWGSQ